MLCGDVGSRSEREREGGGAGSPSECSCRVGRSISPPPITTTTAPQQCLSSPKHHHAACCLHPSLLHNTTITPLKHHHTPSPSPSPTAASTLCCKNPQGVLENHVAQCKHKVQRPKKKILLEASYTHTQTQTHWKCSIAGSRSLTRGAIL